MAHYRLITIVNSVDGKADEMNEWYNNHHVPDLLAVPGVMRAERLNISQSLVPENSAGQYMAVFSLDTDDPMEVMREIRRRTDQGIISKSDTYQLVSMGIYSVIQEATTKP